MDMAQREVVTVTLRITAIIQSFKKKSSLRMFRAVPIDKNTHLKTSKTDFYFVATPADKLALEPCQGQVWTIKGPASTETTPSKRGGKLVDRTMSMHHPHRCTYVMPKGNHAFVEFIKNEPAFKGISADKAKALWIKFGPEIFSLLENAEAAKLQAVDGITASKASILIKGYKKFGNLKYSVWLTSKQIPPEIQHKIFALPTTVKNSRGIEVDVNPVDLVSRNPYCLVNFGLSFAKTDQIATKHFNVAATAKQRLIAAVTDALRAHTVKGHTIAKARDLLVKLTALLGTKSLAELALECGYDSQAYIFNDRTGTYQHTPVYLWENVVARRLLKLKKRSNDPLFDVHAKRLCDAAIAQENARLAQISPDLSLAEQQMAAIHQSVGAAVSCITGGAGTGKTTVLNSVLSVYQQLGYTIKAMALSARAAMRTQESIESLGLKATTIAKFLHEAPLEAPHKKYLVVIDEASMLDLTTMYRIVIHTDPRVRFLLCGDPAQLPPIGPGRVLADIVDSRVIVNTALKIVKRQDQTTGIPAYSAKIRDGIVPADLSTGSIHFHDVDFDNIAAKCASLYAKEPRNCRVVASTNQLVGEINSLCQQTVNAGAALLPSKTGERLYHHDPVLFTANNYEQNVQNGTLGQLTCVKQTETSYGTVRIDGSGELIELTKDLLAIINPGYAITVHKAQGSQFPRVIIGLTAGNFVDRAWLYTAITRAEIELHIVCPRAKLASIIKNPSKMSLRKTTLTQLLLTSDNDANE